MLKIIDNFNSTDVENLGWTSRGDNCKFPVSTVYFLGRIRTSSKQIYERVFFRSVFSLQSDNETIKSQQQWTTAEPTAWYSQTDMCIIKLWKSKIMPLSDFSSSTCQGPSKTAERDGLISVGYGSSYNTTCRPPLESHYLQALKGFNDPRSMTLLHALNDIYVGGRVIVFLGDSMTR